MSAPSIRRSARCLTVLVAAPLAISLLAPPASARPDPGPTAVVDDSIGALVFDGCDPSAAWTDYPGHRGVCLPPAERGHVLEFSDS